MSSGPDSLNHNLKLVSLPVIPLRISPRVSLLRLLQGGNQNRRTRMIITNIGGPVTVGECHLVKGHNEVPPSLWQKAKQHRLIQAFLTHGRLIEGAVAMPPKGLVPPGAVPHDRDAAPVFDPRAGIPTAANLAKPDYSKPAPPKAAEATPAPAPKTEAPPAEAATDEPAEPPEVKDAEAKDAEAKDATEYSATDARLIIKDCTDVETLKGWHEKESRVTVAAEIEKRIAELAA